MKKRFTKAIVSIILLAGVLSRASVVAAKPIKSNGGTVNSHLTNNNGSIIDSTFIGGWHYSGGYWKFNGDGIQTFNIHDIDVPTYFTGTSKTFEKNITVTKTLPDSVQNFIRIYGKEKVGIKLTLGNSGSVLGDNVDYVLSDNTITLTFRPILRYNRNDMFSHWNAGIYNAMKVKTQTPEVTDGYGENYLSIRGGIIGMRIDGNIFSTGYKSGNELRFRSLAETITGDGQVVYANKEVVPQSFFTGGATSAYFRHGMNIEFYDLSVSSYNATISNYEYKIGNTYWVKADDDFAVNFGGSASAYDDLIKVNGNYLKVDQNGSVGYINSTIKHNQNFSNSGVNNASVLNLKSVVANRNGSRLNSVVNASLSGDRDITINSFSRLIHFPDSGGEQIYKEAHAPKQIEIKSDSQSPNISGYPSSNWTKSDVSINLSVTDTRSGVRSTSLHKGSTQVASSNGVISYTESNEGTHDFKVTTSDKVGNVREETFIVKIDKTAPIIDGKPSSDWTKDDVIMNLTADDGIGSGVKSIKLFKGSTQVASSTGVINYTENNEGTHDFKVVTEDNVGNVREEIFIVKIDKTAPTGDVEYDYNDTNSDFKVTVNNIVETGSGLDRVWIEYYPKNTPTRIVNEDLVDRGGKYQGEKNLNDLFPDSIDIVSTRVKAIDKVGNERILSEKDVDTFLVSASIERVLEPNAPIFKTGEKGILKIKLSNGVEKVKITFPKELTQLDNTLNTEMVLVPKKNEEIDYEFFVPLETPSSAYKVQVIGYKNGKEKAVYPSLTVEGSITSLLRTRIRS